MKHFNRSKRESIVAYLCISPAILGIILLMVAPIVALIILGFTDWNALSPATFLGLQNFKDLFTKDYFLYQSIFVTLYYTVGAVISSIVFSFFVAILLNMKIPARGFFRAVFYIPAIVPGIASMILWSWMMDQNFGLFNFILSSVGLPKGTWIYGETTSVPSLLFIATWAAGNLIVVFLAGLQNVPKTYLEAVDIDGGNFWHKFKNVTIPMMTPIIFFNLLMNVITNLQVFVPAFLMTGGGPNNSTLFIVFFIVREAFQNNRVGYAAALAFIFFIFVAAVTALIFFTSKKWVYYEGK